ncbi:hypothetical protein EV188_10188 [Actinomycetospora succinea]|uniref:DUF6194 domain-containing protein n=1 Tax=Actinomycetospora succinea TaxID=663603 RepID=A0A4R6VQY0_9PSEU|nr:DUF6194 family protein [Actinomycetospora succinea]TDQ64840.1 hypothetical protein EV188_10188 [Actinomycetospora succinea]
MDLEIVTAALRFPDTLVIEADGDVYAICDPDGTYEERPRHGFATIVTSDAHDTASDLDRPGVYRLNLGLPRERAEEVVDASAEHDLTALDVLMPHPVYGAYGFVCVLNPDRTWPQVQGLIDEAHAHAAAREGARRPRRTSSRED